MDKIIISTLYSIIAAMGQAFNRDDIEYRDIIGQYFIQPEQQVEIPFLFHINMKKKLRCMNVRVRSSAPDYINGDF